MTPEKAKAVFAPIFGDVVQDKTVGAALDELCRFVRLQALEDAAQVAELFSSAAIALGEDSLKKGMPIQAAERRIEFDAANTIATAIRQLKDKGA